MVVTRVGQVIRVRPEAIDAYERLHADPWPGVLATLRAANIRNYSIFRHGDVLFAYYEYVGTDHGGDLARIAADPVTQAWWRLTDAMQDPYPERADGSWWLDLAEVFHTD
jgi:L-rhamnose mutarotase